MHDRFNDRLSGSENCQAHPDPPVLFLLLLLHQHLMRKVASERMAHKGVDEVSFAQMGNWENEIAKAYQDCYKRTIDWATTARKLSEGYHPTPTCHVWHLDYPVDFVVSPFPALAAPNGNWSARDHRTKELQSLLAPMVHRVGALLYAQNQNASVWEQFAMFSDPRWPAYAAEVNAWTTKMKEDAAASAEQVVSDAMGTINSGLSAKMTQVETRMMQVIDGIRNLLDVTDDGGKVKQLTEVIEVQATTICSQQSSMVELQVALGAKDAEICALREALALAETGRGAEERPSSADAAAAAAAATTTAAAASAAAASAAAAVAARQQGNKPDRYQPGDAKLVSLDVSFRDFAARYHKKPAGPGRRSLGEQLAAAGSLKEFLGSAKTDGAVLRAFQKAKRLDAFVLEHFKVDGGQAAGTTLSEHKYKSYVLADTHYETAYPTMSCFHKNVVETKKDTIQCSAKLNCSGRIVKTNKVTKKQCKTCTLGACSKCGVGWGEDHQC